MGRESRQTNGIIDVSYKYRTRIRIIVDYGLAPFSYLILISENWTSTLHVLFVILMNCT